MDKISGENALPQPAESHSRAAGLKDTPKPLPAVLRMEALLRGYRWVFLGAAVVNAFAVSGLFYFFSISPSHGPTSGSGLHLFGLEISFIGRYFLDFDMLMEIAAFPLNLWTFWALRRPVLASRVLLSVASAVHLLMWENAKGYFTYWLLYGRLKHLALWGTPFYYLVGFSMLGLLCSPWGRKVYSRAARVHFEDPPSAKRRANWIPGVVFTILALSAVSHDMLVLKQPD